MILKIEIQPYSVGYRKKENTNDICSLPKKLDAAPPM